MIDPTRKEWQEARARLKEGVAGDLDTLTEAALGPCPSEPSPVGWRGCEGSEGPLLVTRHADSGGVWVGFRHIQHEKLTPDEADAMAAALTEHARYAREREQS